VLLLWDSGVDMLMVLLLGDLRRWGEGERVMLHCYYRQTMAAADSSPLMEMTKKVKVNVGG
jgi:hypothetical protein